MISRSQQKVADDNMEKDERTLLYPAEYFDPERPIPDPGLIRKAWYPTIFTGVGIGFACFANISRRRPPFSGIQQHAIAASVGLIVGTTLDNYVQRKHAHRDLLLFEYISTHPEDFPPIERKKYAEVLEKWIPIR